MWDRNFPRELSIVCENRGNLGKKREWRCERVWLIVRETVVRDKLHFWVEELRYEYD